MKTSVTLQKDYEHEHVMVSVINMTDVCVSGVGVWNPSRDGSEGDQLQLEEDHQQHQGDLRLQGGSGIVSMERFMEFADETLKFPESGISWRCFCELERYYRIRSFTSQRRHMRLCLRLRLTDWGPGDIFINEAVHPIEKHLEEAFSTKTEYHSMLYSSFWSFKTH